MSRKGLQNGGTCGRRLGARENGGKQRAGKEVYGPGNKRKGGRGRGTRKEGTDDRRAAHGCGSGRDGTRRGRKRRRRRSQEVRSREGGSGRGRKRSRRGQDVRTTAGKTRRGSEDGRVATRGAGEGGGGEAESGRASDTAGHPVPHLTNGLHSRVATGGAGQTTPGGRVVAGKPVGPRHRTAGDGAILLVGSGSVVLDSGIPDELTRGIERQGRAERWVALKGEQTGASEGRGGFGHDGREGETRNGLAKERGRKDGCRYGGQDAQSCCRQRDRRGGWRRRRASEDTAKR